MKKKGLSHSEPVTLEVAKKIRDNALPNLSGLEKFGIGPAQLSTFSEDIDTTEALRNQDTNRLQQDAKTIDKNNAVIDGFIWAGDMGERVKQTFKKDSPEYAEFPYGPLEEARGSERKLMPVLESAIDYGVKYADQLAGAGHTPEIQAQGQSKLDAIKGKDEIQETKKETNKSDTQVRYEKFDNLIKTVNKITAAGRKAFRNQPEKLVLFQSPWPKRKKKTPPTPPPPAQ